MTNFNANQIIKNMSNAVEVEYSEFAQELILSNELNGGVDVKAAIIKKAEADLDADATIRREFAEDLIDDDASDFLFIEMQTFTSAAAEV